MIKFKECRHIKTDGKKCHSPAMRGSAYCYFHAWPRRRPPATRLSAANSARHQAPSPAGKIPEQLIDTSRIGTHGAIHDALTQVIAALGSSRMSPRRRPPATRLSAANSARHQAPSPAGKIPEQLIDTSRIGTHGAIHDALTQVIAALGSSRMSPRRAAVLLHGLQIAAHQIELHGPLPPELE